MWTRKDVGYVPEMPVARSPIRPTPPIGARDGWEVSLRRAHGALRLADHTPQTKVLVRASADGRLAVRLGVRFGQAIADGHGTLVVGSGRGEWLLLAPPNSLDAVTSRLDAADDDLVSVVDVTHGRALMRLTGADAHRLLAKLCAIDLASGAPDGTALRTSVAEVATDVVRDDMRSTMERSYLMHCERSTGQHLFDALLDAGREFGVEVDGARFDDARPQP
jgi:heterotetrameric sarcosine oxidase gamma subunit